MEIWLFERTTIEQMSTTSRQYVFAAIFIAVAVYQATRKDYLEVILYTMAGMAFILNALSLEPRLEQYKRGLVITTWGLIVATGIFFLYMLQFKF